MKVLVYNQDGQALPDDGVIDALSVVRYSRSIMGGPSTCVLSSQMLDNPYDYLNLIQRRVEIVGESGDGLWHGWASRITVPYGQLTLSLSAENVYNRVCCVYPALADGEEVATEQAVTEWAEDAISIAEFGVREMRLNLFDANQEVAEGARDQYLEDHKDATVEVSQSPRGSVEIACRGWWRTLGAKYYANPSTVNVDLAAQIEDVITACGQYFGNVTISASGIESNPFQAGDLTGLKVIEELMRSGGLGSRRYIADVTHGLEIVFTQIPAVAVAYLLNMDGDLEGMTGNLIDPKLCTVGQWMTLKEDLPLSGPGVLRPMFIGSAEYTAATNKTIYKPYDMRNLYALGSLTQ